MAGLLRFRGTMRGETEQLRRERWKESIYREEPGHAPSIALAQRFPNGTGSGQRIGTLNWDTVSVVATKLNDSEWRCTCRCRAYH